MKSSSKPEDLIVIGRIVGAHGIHGVVKVYSYAESPTCFTLPEGLTMVDARGTATRCHALWVRPRNNGLCMAFKDVTNRDQAERLAGCELLIPRSSLPKLDEDTYYWIDLIGMTVYDTHRSYLGRVADIIQTGANDVYVVETPEGYPVKEILLPAIASVVLEVDAEQRVMRVALPEGLI